LRPDYKAIKDRVLGWFGFKKKNNEKDETFNVPFTTINVPPTDSKFLEQKRIIPLKINKEDLVKLKKQLEKHCTGWGVK